MSSEEGKICGLVGASGWRAMILIPENSGRVLRGERKAFGVTSKLWALAPILAAKTVGDWEGRYPSILPKPESVAKAAMAVEGVVGRQLVAGRWMLRIWHLGAWAGYCDGLSASCSVALE